MDEFARLHPLVNIIYFAGVIGITMFQMHPIMIGISLICSLIYFFFLKREKGIKYVGMIAVVIVVSAFINPMFSHKGMTLLFYLPTGNPVTLESIIYGVAAAVILGTVLIWFACFNKVMTKDKMLAGIGSIMPHVATLITMVCGFVPKYIGKSREIHRANKAMGANYKGIRNKLKSQMKEFSMTTTWALENSADTADSMKSRGYGTGRRTYYSDYRLTYRDCCILILEIIILGINIWLMISGKINAFYYPEFRMNQSILVYITYAMLCLMPVLVNGVEEVRWRILRSKI